MLGDIKTHKTLDKNNIEPQTMGVHIYTVLDSTVCSIDIVRQVIIQTVKIRLKSEFLYKTNILYWIDKLFNDGIHIIIQPI